MIRIPGTPYEFLEHEEFLSDHGAALVYANTRPSWSRQLRAHKLLDEKNRLTKKGREALVFCVTLARFHGYPWGWDERLDKRLQEETVP